MELLKFVRLSVVLVSMVSGRRLYPHVIRQLTNNQIRHLNKNPTQGSVICARLSKEPYFEEEILLGRTWRVYYTWNMDFENQCMDMVFTYATPSIVNHIHKHMIEYLKSDPDWDAAKLLVNVGRARHQMLLFSDQGAAGRFQGVPNVIGDRKYPEDRVQKKVPLLNFHLKMMYGGKYLLMADCQNGVTTLSSNRRLKPYRAEIAGIADSLDFGPGQQACTADEK